MWKVKNLIGVIKTIKTDCFKICCYSVRLKDKSMSAFSWDLPQKNQSMTNLVCAFCFQSF